MALLPSSSPGNAAPALLFLPPRRERVHDTSSFAFWARQWPRPLAQAGVQQCCQLQTHPPTSARGRPCRARHPAATCSVQHSDFVQRSPCSVQYLRSTSARTPASAQHPQSPPQLPQLHQPTPQLPQQEGPKHRKYRRRPSTCALHLDGRRPSHPGELATRPCRVSLHCSSAQGVRGAAQVPTRYTRRPAPKPAPSSACLLHGPPRRLPCSAATPPEWPEAALLFYLCCPARALLDPFPRSRFMYMPWYRLRTPSLHLPPHCASRSQGTRVPVPPRPKPPCLKPFPPPRLSGKGQEKKKVERFHVPFQLQTTPPRPASSIARHPSPLARARRQPLPPPAGRAHWTARQEPESTRRRALGKESVLSSPRLPATAHATSQVSRGFLQPAEPCRCG